MVNVDCVTKNQYVMFKKSTIIVTLSENDMYNVTIIEKGIVKYFNDVTFKTVQDLIACM